MNVIKHGKPKITLKRFECEVCGCIFEADKDEYTGHSQYNEMWFIARCPECGGRACEKFSR